MKALGTGSSPQCTDLNNDRTLDIVLGAGENENVASDSSVIAVDGKTGELLWAVAASNQIVGSAIFLDVTDDGIAEVFIGGRSAEYMCINGATGQVLWRFKPSDENDIMRCCFRYNFVNAQFIHDVDADGYGDLLISNGGNADARPFTMEGRHPGVIAIMSSRSGNVIVADTVPDGQETYMTPVVHDFLGSGKKEVVIGTGGETLGGHLFRFSLNDLLDGKIDSMTTLLTRNKYGFMAPPTIAEVNGDGVKDMVVNWFGGSMIAIDGKTNDVIWEARVPETETYSMPVPGRFNADSVTDFFSLFNKGAWPRNIGSVQVMVNGADGTVIFRDSLGCMGYSTPVSFDSNGDGYDEVLYSVNSFFCDPPAFAGDDIINSKHTLQLFDFHNTEKRVVGEKAEAKNISSTPWVGDLDSDGYLDIVYCIQRNQLKVVDYSGIQIERLTTRIPAHNVTWGSYLGPNSTAIFEP